MEGWIGTLFLIGFILFEVWVLWTYYFYKIVPHRHLHLHQLGNPDKLIWSYWHSNRLPPTVQLALASWQHFHPDWTIHMLTADTVGQYLSPSDLHPSFPSQSKAHQSDIIRIALLEKYGGLWLDSSIILQRRIDEDWFPQTYDVGGFYIDAFTADPQYKVFENWFISAPPRSPLIRAWKTEFYKAMDFKDRSDYINQLKQEKLPIDKIDGPEYLMMHCCFIKVLKNAPAPYNIRQIEVGDPQQGPFSYLVRNQWNSLQAVKTLVALDADALYHQSILKLRGCERPLLDKLLRWKGFAVHSQSACGKILAQVNKGKR